MKEEALLQKTALDAEGKKLGRVTHITSNVLTQETKQSAVFADIKPDKRKYNEITISIELNQILRQDEKTVQFSITEKEFLERAINEKIERDKQKEIAKQQEKIAKLRQKADDIQRMIL